MLVNCRIMRLFYAVLGAHGGYFWLGVRYCFMRLSLTVDSSRSMSEPSFSFRDSCRQALQIQVMQSGACPMA